MFDFLSQKSKVYDQFIAFIRLTLKLLQGRLLYKLAIASSTSLAEILKQFQAQVDVPASPPLPLNQAQDIFSPCFSMDLNYFLEEEDNEFGDFGVGEVELNALGQEQGFLELQAFLIQVFQHKLGLFDIQALQRYCQQSLEAVDPHLPAALEGEEGREVLEGLTLVLMSVEEKQRYWVLNLKVGAWSDFLAQLSHPVDELFLEQVGHPHHLAIEQKAPVKLHLAGGSLQGTIEAPIYDPANPFCLKRRGFSVLIGNLYFFYRVEILKFPKAIGKEMDEFIKPIAEEDIISYCLQDVVQQLRLEKTLPEALIECPHHLGASRKQHSLIIGTRRAFQVSEELDVCSSHPILAFGNEGEVFFGPVLAELSGLIFYIKIILDYTCRNLYKARQEPSIVQRGSDFGGERLCNDCENDQASPFIRVRLVEVFDYIVSRFLELSFACQAVEQVKDRTVPLTLQKLSSSLPVKQGKCDQKRMLPVTLKDRLELLVVVSKLQPHFREVLFNVDLNDSLQDISLLLATQLFIFQQLREHL